MASIKSRILGVEDDFLTCLAEGEASIVAFNTRWEALLEDITAAMDSATVDEATLSLCHTTAMRIATLADISADLTSTYDAHTTLLFAQLDSLMAELSLEDDPSPFSLTPYTMDPIDCSSKRSNSKRRRSPDACQQTSPRSLKRQRVATPTETTSSPTPPLSSMAIPSVTFNLPPPPPTCLPPAQDDLLHEGPHEAVAHDFSRAPLDILPPTKRKRRLSDSDASFKSSSAKRVFLGPRLHAVSDSFASFGIPFKGPQLASSPTPCLNLGSLSESPSSPSIPSQNTMLSADSCAVFNDAGLGFVDVDFTPSENLEGLEELISLLTSDEVPLCQPATPSSHDASATFSDLRAMDPCDTLPPISPSSPASTSSQASSRPITPQLGAALDIGPLLHSFSSDGLFNPSDYPPLATTFDWDLPTSMSVKETSISSSPRLLTSGGFNDPVADWSILFTSVDPIPWHECSPTPLTTPSPASLGVEMAGRRVVPSSDDHR